MCFNIVGLSICGIHNCDSNCSSTLKIQFNIVNQKWINLNVLDSLGDKFCMQNTIAGYIQSIEVLYNYKFPMHCYFFSFKQNDKAIFVLKNKC